MLSKQYLAGFIDGEGYISLITHKDIRTKRRYTLDIRFQIDNTNKAILERIQDLIGGTIRLKSKSTDKWKEVYRLELKDLNRIEKVVKQILPYIFIKKEQCKLIIAYCRSRKNNINKGYSDKELEIVQLFKKLNKRGV